MKKKIIFTGILSLIAVLVLVFGCAIEKPAVNEEETLVAFNIGQDMLSAKTIIPNQPMDITQYVVKWWKVGTDTTGVDPPSSQIKTVNLAENQTSAFVWIVLTPGEYIFKVEGNNKNGFQIGAGYPNPDNPLEPVVIYPATPKQIFITIKPLDGSGTLYAEVTWPGVDFGDLVPAVVATITPLGGNPTDAVDIPLSVDMVNEIATATETGLDDGYYRFYIKMIEFGTTNILWSTWDALRIIEADTSQAIYELTDALNALVAVQIDEDLNNPLKIVFEVNGIVYDGTDVDHTLPVPFTITQGESLEIIARPYDSELYDPANPNIGRVAVSSFEWYKRGTYTLTGNPESILSPSYSIVTVGSGDNPGYYWIDLLVTNESQTSLTSERIEYLVLSP
jgi:hypothetical protein